MYCGAHNDHYRYLSITQIDNAVAARQYCCAFFLCYRATGIGSSMQSNPAAEIQHDP